MKKFLITFIAIVVSLAVIILGGLYLLKEVSGSVVDAMNEVDDVNKYTTFIEDEVRYSLACANPKYAYADLDNAELESKATSKIGDYASSFDDIEQPSYKLALTKMSKEGNSYEQKYAAGLLKIYNELKIELTPFEKDATNEHKWHFQEKNSRVHYTANIGILSIVDADEWDLDRYTEYLETGKFKEAPSAKMDNENANGNVWQFVTDLYNNKISDEVAMSKEFFENSNAAIDWDNMDEWNNFTENGYWKYPNNSTHKFSITKINKVDGGNGYYEAVVRISTKNGERLVQLTLKAKGTSYCVTDICTLSDEGDLELCYSDVFSESIAEQDHEGNY